MAGREWWREGVLYQIYPRSFADSNGDGVGDLPGVTSKLDYLEWLGIDGIWLNPTMPSPNADWGYDVADYCDVHPDFGTLADLDELIVQADSRGIRILLDLVPNHSSDRHPWFADSRGSRTSPRRDWYFWRDPNPDGSTPNNWRSVFAPAEPAWELDLTTGQMYLHHFLREQPDLNWWNEEVRLAFDGIQRFWFDRGVAGFRIDVVSELVKLRELQDEGGEPEQYGRHADLLETHRVLKRWRAIADSYDPPRLMLGETWALDAPGLASFHGDDDELHLSFNFPFMLAPLDAEIQKIVVEESERAFAPGAWHVWTGSNHDFARFPTRWCEDDERKVRCALLLLLALRGTPVLYYGDELGQRQVDVTGADVRDIAGRDGARTPMHWSAEPGAGFTEPGVKPWLPFGDFAGRNVEAERQDPGSTLSLVRDLIAFRRGSAELRGGSYAAQASPDGTWVWRRGEGTVVALNLSDSDAAIDGIEGTVRVATDRGRDGERVDGSLALPAWSGALVS
ncbi:MAG: alpha-amylase family glycosyl hydrolase [Actinomycetota bacterium]|nr:alpha-amylase family glycosyl hydrolase [Actinomycetota bacterium]